MVKYITLNLIIIFCFACEEAITTHYEAYDFTNEHEFTPGIEGPATDASGNIYAVNYKEKGSIGVITPEGKSQLYVNLPEGSIGNGIRMNNQGHLLIADYTGHNILQSDPEQKDITVFMHNPKLNQPNDLAIMKNQTLFLSDPNWKESTGNLWRVSPTGDAVLVESDMGTTNGVEVSPDEKTLYVNESVQRNVWAYDLNETGEVSNKRLLIKFEDYGMDGMRCDVEGNLYITRHGKGSVVIVSPIGEVIKEVMLKGKKPSNITFGGPEGKTCYVTLQDRGCLEYFKTEYAGREWSWINRII